MNHKEKAKTPTAKKILKWIAIVLLVLLIGLISIPFLFKDKIVQMVANTVNNNIHATVTFTATDLSLFRNFPLASLKVNNIAVINKEPFLGDTLFNAKELNLNLKITELFKSTNETLEIKSISAENGKVNIIFNKNSIGNYDIALKKETTPSSSTESSLSLNIQEYQLENMHFRYIDESSQMKMSLDSIYHTGKGNFAKDILDLDTETSAKLSFDIENVNYIKNVSVKLDAILGIDLKNLKYTFKENTGYINQLPLEFEGFIQLVEENHLYDIAFKTPTSSFKNLLALVPKQYSGNLASVTTEGNFDLNGTVKGRYSKTTIPKLNISFTSKNAMFKYADLPKAVQNINLNANIINKTGLAKDTYIAINNTSFRIDKDVFNASGNISNITENANINLKANGTINLANLSKVYPVKLENQLEGILKADVTTNFDMNSVDKGNYQNIKNKGNITVSNFKYKGEDVANEFLIDKTSVTFNTNTIKLEEFKAKTGASDLDIFGNLENFYGYLFKNQSLKGNFTLSSNNFKVDDFLAKTEEKTNTTDSKTLKIPAFLDVQLNAKATNVVYDNITLKNVVGNLRVKDETVNLQNVSSNIFDGKIDFNGKVSTKGNHSNFKMDLKLQELNIAESFSQLEMLKAIAPIAESLEGKINSTINVSGDLSEDMTPVLKSISGNLLGQLLNTKLKIANSKVLSTIGSKVDFLDVSKLNLNEASALFTFNNGEVSVKPFHINYKDIGIDINGKHGFDNTMNYDIVFNLPVKYLGPTVTNAIAKLTAKDANEIKTIPVNANLKGSFSNPNFTTNIKDATSNLMKTIIEKQKQNWVDKGKNKLLDLLGGSKDKAKDSTNTNETTKDKVKNVLGGLFGKKKKDTVKNDSLKKKNQ
ncbi:AsmA-like C-terminal region-containing protein [Polaribacter batillariae]|uniref:AsmA-like C-terminal region-containing protein n=1 Tax=Polaribacter batillariae TaxID=2808900 RepID=A0ABX7SV87_9FLAO|nr:AsmA-like C-terminal region-containing protein [Polaribacter batillariae]QTD38162.1 AsmA-like C-terminal region-containing protein [Polaribacter batillariae]